MFKAMLAKKIHVIDSPLWSESGKAVYISGSGGSTQVSFEKPRQDSEQFQTLTLDDTVEKFAIPKLDMIKMDVEGAEYPILLGAKETLLKFRPKLAISLYHSDEDFSRIPQFLDSLDCGYEFSLAHHSLHQGETVLYARTTKP